MQDKITKHHCLICVDVKIVMHINCIFRIRSFFFFTDLDCSFTNGDFCGYYESRTDDFDWTLGTGPTPSSDTGPASDHTTGTGDYIYIETSTPQKPGDKAVLLSSLMPATGE